ALEGGTHFSLALADFNGNGSPDLVMTSNNNTVFEGQNNGSGGFGAVFSINITGPTNGINIGDLNNDGQQDWVMICGSTVNILLNQVASTASTVVVSPGPATHFAIGRPASATAGSAFNVSVAALDQFNNTVTGYTGTVRFTSSDSAGVLPANATLTSGTGVFSVLMKTAGSRTLTTIDTANSTITAVSSTITVNPAAATHFALTTPASVTFGNAFNFTIIARDPFNNTAAGYTGAVHFTSSDATAALPADASLTNGAANLSAVLNTAGSQTLTATDSAVSSITGTSNPIVPAPTHFVVAAPSSSTAGDAFVFLVTAEDQFNHTAAGYTGTVHFSSTDNKAGLPADVTLSNGFGFFATILKTAGSQTLTVADKANSALMGTTSAIVIGPAAVNHFGLAVPANAATGSAFNFTVTALDPYNNVLTNYSGTVHFTSSDAAASLPADGVLANGTGTFSATLKTLGSQILIATDTVSSNITGTSSFITDRGLVVTNLNPTPTGFVAQFNKPFDASNLNLYDGVSTYGPADVTVIGPAGLIRGSLLLDPSNSSFTFIKTGVGAAGLFPGVLPAGNYSVTFRSAVNAFKDLDGLLLDGNNDGASGDNYVTTFTVGASSQPVLSVPDFARGPNGAVNIKVPQLGGSGIPITLTNAAGVTDVTFNLNYNPALLNITSTLSNTSGTFTLVGAPSSGVANFSFHSSTALNGNLTLGQIVAQVPDSAAASYKAKELLHLSNIVVNGSITTAINDDGIHVAAYPGDVSGDGLFSPLDGALTSRVAIVFDTGFAAYRLADPAILGDLNGNGFTDSSDVTLINRTLAGITVAQLPPIPTSLTISPTGPDPTLSLPTDLQAASGTAVVAPVYLDTASPEGSTGLMEAVLALRYDPKVFTVSAQDVHLGTLPTSGSGWKLQAVVNAQMGEIGIDLFSATPIVSAAGGSLVTLTLHVLPGAPSGASGINLVRAVNPTGQRQYVTTASDAAGPYILHPAVTDYGDPGVDGMVSVLATPTLLIQAKSDPAVEFDDPNTAAQTVTAMPLALPRNQVTEQVDRIFADLGVASILSANPELHSHDPLADSAFEDTSSFPRDLVAALPTAEDSAWNTAAEDHFAKLGLAMNRARKISKNCNASGFEPYPGQEYDGEKHAE
ncbi:MAG TPA: FG-GAP-like repeat-containing protein, partial [Gemmataceae bacterium]|nr:FG-GAP-like repeat-containing protein [Gemmataceae bacterium]